MIPSLEGRNGFSDLLRFVPRHRTKLINQNYNATLKQRYVLYILLWAGRIVSYRPPRFKIVEMIEEIVHTTQNMVLILTSLVNKKFFVKIHDIPRISPPTIKPIIITVTVVSRMFIIIGRSSPFGPNAAAIAPTSEMMDIPMK